RRPSGLIIHQGGVHAMPQLQPSCLTTAYIKGTVLRSLVMASTHIGRILPTYVWSPKSRLTLGRIRFIPRSIFGNRGRNNRPKHKGFFRGQGPEPSLLILKGV